MLRYDYDLFSLALGKRVRELRKERGMSLRALAREYGYHLTSFERLEQGKGISVRTILRLAETFQIPVEELIASLGTVKTSPREKPPRKRATKPVRIAKQEHDSESSGASTYKRGERPVF